MTLPGTTLIVDINAGSLRAAWIVAAFTEGGLLKLMGIAAVVWVTMAPVASGHVKLSVNDVPFGQLMSRICCTSF